jgi:O-antigen/teichoic acid export membrane protein
MRGMKSTGMKDGRPEMSHDPSQGWIRGGARRLRRKLAPGGFSAKVATLAGGTTVAQLITVAASPILSRLYLPSDYGTLATLNAVAGLLAILASLRYQLAITLVRDEQQARDLLGICLGLTAVFMLMVGFISWTWAEPLFDLLNLSQAKAFWWFIPLAAGGLAAYESLYYWTLRHREYGTLSRTRVWQAVTGVGSSLGIRTIQEGPLGLLVGGILLKVAGCWTLLRRATKRPAEGGAGGVRSRPQKIAREYAGFAAFSTLAALLNASGILLPPLLITAWFGSTEAGSFGFAFRLISLPMTLVGAAVSQVFLAEAARLIRDRPEEVWPLFRRITHRLAPLATVMLVGAVACPLVFPWVFGSRWGTAGIMGGMLAVSMAAQILVSPISNIAVLLKRQGLQCGLDAVRAVVVVLTFWLPARMGLTAIYAVAWYAGSMTVLYGGYYLTYRWLAKRVARRTP